jgi:hypothetical protein
MIARRDRRLVGPVLTRRDPGLVELACDLFHLLLRDLLRRLRPRLLSPLLLRPVDVAQLRQEYVGSLHRHATKVWDEVCTRGMASEVTLRAFASILATEREHVATVAAPVSADVGDRLESMGYTVVNLHFVTILRERSSAECVPERRLLLTSSLLLFEIHLVTTFS